MTPTYAIEVAGNGVNRTAMRVIAGSVTNTTAYTLGGGNRLASWTGGGACAYDTAGCVTNLVRSGKPAVALEWDAQYRVTAAYTNGVLAESYGYDALGRRATVTANSVTTHYVNEGPHVVAETDAAGNLLRRYEYGPGVDDILTMTVFSGGVTNTYRYVKDIQNTVWAIRDAAGTIVESYDYDAWGNVLAVRDGAGNPLTESAIGNRYLFQGREYSWATGLYNFRARWYDPETGRWLSNDPIGISGGLNLYEFCGGSPPNIVDPYGDSIVSVISEWYHKRKMNRLIKKTLESTLSYDDKLVKLKEIWDKYQTCEDAGKAYYLALRHLEDPQLERWMVISVEIMKRTKVLELAGERIEISPEYQRLKAELEKHDQARKRAHREYYRQTGQLPDVGWAECE